MIKEAKSAILKDMENYREFIIQAPREFVWEKFFDEEFTKKWQHGVIINQDGNVEFQTNNPEIHTQTRILKQEKSQFKYVSLVEFKFVRVSFNYEFIATPTNETKVKIEITHIFNNLFRKWLGSNHSQLIMASLDKDFFDFKKAVEDSYKTTSKI